MRFDDLLAGAAGLREYMQREERVRSVIGRPYVTRVSSHPLPEGSVLTSLLSPINGCIAKCKESGFFLGV
jgi:hypothetical protein